MLEAACELPSEIGTWILLPTVADRPFRRVVQGLPCVLGRAEVARRK